MRLIPHDQHLNGGFTLYWSIRWGRLSFRISTFFCECLEQFATFVFKKSRTKGINGVEGNPLRATKISMAISW